MRFVFLIAFCCIHGILKAQYISRSEPVPYDCPVICAGGILMIKVPQVQNFASGTQIQAQLSNSAGSFNTGSSLLVTLRHSFNQGSSWNGGAYFFTNNVNDLYLEVQIPANQTPGSNYTIRMRAASGYVANDLFQCNAGNKITVTPAYTPLPQINDTVWGINRWFAHAYTWSSNTAQILNSAALVSQQSFFSASNYQGYFIKNALSFDLNYTVNGGKMPGPLNVFHDGTSFNCGEGYSVNYSVRFLRKQFFNPGKYRVDIAADDGIRLSIDGGQTWLLDAFIEQSYLNSYKTTNTVFPDGICLNGEVALVVEYFQRPVDARVTVNFTLLSEIASDIGNVTLCEGESASFFAGNAIAGATYQWEISDVGQNNYSNLALLSPYSGVQSHTLSVNPVSVDLNNSIFRCRIEGVCPNPVYTDTALLKVLNDAEIFLQPSDAFFCPGDTAVFEVITDASQINWEMSQDSGMNFLLLDELAPFAGTRSARLNIFPGSDSLKDFLFRARIESCSGLRFSEPVRLKRTFDLSQPYIPNVVTANSDGKNDVFRTQSNGLTISELLVYDRWGIEVFSSKISGNFEWNPLEDSLPAGVYYYIIKYLINCSNTSEEKHGIVTVFY